MNTYAPVVPAGSPHRCPYCHIPLEVEIGHDDGPSGDGTVRFWLRCDRCDYSEEDRSWLGPAIAAVREITARSREHRAKLLADIQHDHPAVRLLKWRLGQ